MADPLTTGIAAIVGACAGGFCATVAIRTARGKQALKGRSACDDCGLRLGFASTVPVISYVQAGGACRQCGGRIDRLHLVGEISGAAVVALSFAAVAPFRAAVLACLGLVLLTASMIDIRTRRLPDVATALVAGLAVMLAALRGLDAVATGVLCGALTWCVLQTVRWICQQRSGGHEGLGGGDVKLMAALAIWLGTATPWVLALAAATGLMGTAVFRPRDGRLPFGPFIAVATLVIGFWGEVQL